MIFNRLSIAGKLWSAVAFIIVALIAVLAITSVNSARINAESAKNLQAANTKSESVHEWSAMTTLNVNRLQASMLSADPSVDAFFKEQVAATIKQISEVQKRIESMELTDSEKAQMAKIAALRKTVLDELAAARKLKDAGDQAGASARVQGPFNAAITPYLGALREFADSQVESIAEVEKASTALRNANTRNAGIYLFLLIAAIAAGALALIRSIRQPLNKAVDFAQQVAKGDLTVRLTHSSNDEIGALVKALDDMREQLVSVVADVRRGTDNITVASEEIATGNHDLSARTEQTASSLEETAASMEQMSGAIKQSADSARMANQLADSAGTSAQKGGEVVGQVVTTMEEINTASRKIHDIISVIDGIAFQTNILALNAAVEAARAGEQGRGFAVVAGEVRTLAQRSAQAAKEIKELIGNTVSRVDAGTALVAQAGETMQEIVQNVVRVRDIIGEIASSAAEQADGVNQINSAVANLDQMTQQNAALVEESAAAASSMSEQAAQLSKVVQTFRLSDTDLRNSHIQVMQAHSHSTASKASARPAPVKPAKVSKPAQARVAAPKAATAPASSRLSAPAPKADQDSGEWESF
jgi:methyl-accepting chemotaxis protein